MGIIDPVTLAQDLVRIDTSGPRATEAAVAAMLGGMLSEAGFHVSSHELVPGRPSIIARVGGEDRRPMVFSGHLDTVPVGQAEWRFPPFGGAVREGILEGRGSADMKGGVAAMVSAAIWAAGEDLRRPLVLILTAAEEIGCLGAIHLRDRGLLPRAAAIVIGEPTGNRLGIGHRGALWLRAVFEGRGAHGSMPHLGHNAIYDASEAISRCRQLDLGPSDALLGRASLNVGTIQGGGNVNSVPDHAEFTVDLRSVVPGSHEALAHLVADCLGPSGRVETMIDLPAVRTDPTCRFATVATGLIADRGTPVVVPFFTDGSVLAAACQAPTIIFGPGDSVMAHQTDETCSVEQINEAAAVYKRMATIANFDDD